MKYLLIFLMMVGSAFGADKHIRIHGGDNGDGTTWATAGSPGGTGCFNTFPGNAAYDRDIDTYWVASGTYTHTESIFINTDIDGTKYITIKKATESAHGSAVGWETSYGVGQMVFDVTAVGAGIQIRHHSTYPTKSSGYVIFDGVTGGGPDSWKSGHGFKIISSAGETDDQALITIGNSSDDIPPQVHIKHVEMTNTNNVEASKTTPFVIRQDKENVTSAGGDGQNTGYTVEYCYVYNCQTYVRSTLVENLLIQYNFFERNLRESVGDNSQLQFMNDNSGKDFIIRWNIFRNMSGTGLLVLKKDLAEFVIDNTHQPEPRCITSGWEVYGNLIYHDSDLPDWAFGFADRGWFGDTSKGAGFDDQAEWATNDMLVYNNTIANSSSTAQDTSRIGIEFNGDDSTGNIAKNNLYYNWDTVNGDEVDFYQKVTVDFNWYAELLGGADDHEYAGILAAAETDGQEGDGNPFASISNQDYRLLENTDTGIDTGASVAGNDEDMFGNERGVDGFWNRGALQVLGSAGGGIRGRYTDGYRTNYRSRYN